MKRWIPTLILLAAVVVTAIGVVHARHESRKAFVQLVQVDQQYDEMNVEWGRLQLEQATWAETGRVENVAREELAMRAPRNSEIVVVER